MMINEIAQEIHTNAEKHGWWDEPRNFGELIALCHSELSEALEEGRADRPFEYFVDANKQMITDMSKWHGEKTEGVAVELCDCIIRILDILDGYGLDVDKVMRRKMIYNEARPYKHGKKF